MRKLVGVLIAALALVASSAGHAQQRPSQAQLKQMIEAALADSAPATHMANPQIVGIPNDNQVFFKGISGQSGDIEYFFAVFSPRRADGLLLFTRDTRANAFRMHRTDTHLRRVASAQNAAGKLSVWAGGDAEADMARQLAYWAANFR